MNVYYYIYYKVYRMAERSSMPWWSDFRAEFLISSIEMALLALAEYKISLLLSIQGAGDYGLWGYGLIIGAPPLILNHFLFLYGNRWKKIVWYFDEVNKQEKKKMDLQMAVVLLLVGSLFVFLLLL